jgi:hypothetical protein
MKWNVWWLPVLLGCALGAVYVLPKAGDTADSAVEMELPGTMGGWSFEKQAASKVEIETLGSDTRFAKANCFRSRPGEMDAEGYLIPDRLNLSIVLSGYDLNSSIHRPERCMPAQGHTINTSSDVAVQLSNGSHFKAKRLRSVQSIPGPKKGEIVAEFNCVTYYFFVGHDQITNDHLERTFIDMKDRLVRGMDQRWAYVSVSMWYGKIPWIAKEVTEAEVDEKLQKFVKGFSEKQIDWDQVRH